MKKYEHLRAKALKFRAKGMALPEICDRLNKGKTTVYYWIKDAEKIGRTEKQSAARLAASKKNVERHTELRAIAYSRGEAEAETIMKDSKIRDFATIYMCEGYRKTRHTVSVANSDPAIIFLAYQIIKTLANPSNKISFLLQMHIDQNEKDLQDFWARLIGIKSTEISTIRKSNSGMLGGRTWASKYGVFTVRVGDTYLKQRIDAWMNYLRNSWTHLSAL